MAQYIPPPAAQTFAPAGGVSTAVTPPAATEAPRTSRRSTRAEPTAVAEPTKTRKSSRRARAEARAAARAAAIEAKAEKRREAAAARAAKLTKAAPPSDEPALAPAAMAAPMAAAAAGSSAIILLTGEAQTTNARSGTEIASLMSQAGVSINVRGGKISLAQLSDPDGTSDADLAILQSDALETARREGGPALTRKLTFVARLYNQEIHIVARAAIPTFTDLDGRVVAVGALETPEGRTASNLFERTGIKPRLLVMDQKTAVDRLASGEIDAAIFVGGKPVPALVDMPPKGLHLLGIPYKGALQDFYYPAQIRPADYPGLVQGTGVDTVAIGTVLVAMDAKPGSPRYKKLSQFTEVFFSRFGALRDPSNHPKWREVNLAADVPGWRRFMPAQKWLDQAPAPRLSSVK